MLGHCNGTHTRTPATVRNTEGLVQVHVADIGTNKGRLCNACLGIEVGPIHVDLTTDRMHLGADGFNAGLKDTVGGWVGDHKRAEILGMLLNFCLKIGEVDVALGIAAHHHNGKTHHLGGCGVGAMR